MLKTDETDAPARRDAPPQDSTADNAEARLTAEASHALDARAEPQGRAPAPAAPQEGDRPDEPEGDKPDGSEGRPGDKEPGKEKKGDADEKQGKEGDKSGEEDEEEDDRSRLDKLKDFVRAHPIGVGIGAIVLIAAIVAAVLWYLHARHFESTDDAFVDARVFAIAPKVGGYLVDVPVTDNQHVDAGALIAQVDRRDYQVAVDQAQAQVQSGEASVRAAAAQVTAQQSQVGEAQAQVQQNEAALEFARDENRRAQELVQKGAGTVQRAQQTASELVQANANLARAQATLNAAVGQIAVLEGQRNSAAANLAQANAQLEQARLNLSYTRVTADQAGRIARLTAAKGQLAQAGTALTMLVPDDLWVTANYKETQLTDMRPGQPVDMTIDAYPDRVLQGRVDSIQRGSGTVFSLLPAQNATGNYVKVVQRVPVKLVFDNIPSDIAVGPGMSVVPKVRVR